MAGARSTRPSSPRAAFPAWSSTPVADRAAVVTRIRDGIKARAGELAVSITAEMGSPISFSNQVQLGMPMATSKGVLGLAEEFAWTEELGNSLVVREASQGSTPMGSSARSRRGTTRCTRSWPRSRPRCSPAAPWCSSPARSRP